LFKKTIKPSFQGSKLVEMKNNNGKMKNTVFILIILFSIIENPY